MKRTVQNAITLGRAERVPLVPVREASRLSNRARRSGVVERDVVDFLDAHVVVNLVFANPSAFNGLAFQIHKSLTLYYRNIMELIRNGWLGIEESRTTYDIGEDGRPAADVLRQSFQDVRALLGLV